MVRIDPIAQSGAAFVEHDEAAEGSEPAQEVSVSRILPVDIEIGDKAGNEEQIDRSVTYDLVGDANVSAACVMGRRLRHGLALPNAGPYDGGRAIARPIGIKINGGCLLKN